MSLYTVVAKADGTVERFENTDPISLSVPLKGVRFVRSRRSLLAPLPVVTGPAPLYRAPGWWLGESKSC